MLYCVSPYFYLSLELYTVRVVLKHLYVYTQISVLNGLIWACTYTTIILEYGETSALLSEDLSALYSEAFSTLIGAFYSALVGEEFSAFSVEKFFAFIGKTFVITYGAVCSVLFDENVMEYEILKGKNKLQFWKD